MNYLKVPDSNIKLTDGSVVMLARFPGTKWVVHYGWYDYSGRRGMGWYFSSIPAQTIIPVTSQDLQLIVLIDQGKSDDPVRPPIPDVDPAPTPGPDFPPKPPHHRPHHDHPDHGFGPVPPWPVPIPDPGLYPVTPGAMPPPPPTGDPRAYFSKNDQYLLDASWITLPSIKYRDALSTVCNMPDGKMVMVLNVDGITRYYRWNGPDQRWDEKFFENDAEKLLLDYYDKEEIDATVGVINNSINALETADTTINEKIDTAVDTLNEKIDNSVTELEASVTATEEGLATLSETVQDTTSELTTRLEDEITARTESINAERTSRIAADAAEQSDRQAADAQLQAAITEHLNDFETFKNDVDHDFEVETNARVAADNAEIQARIEAINTEAATRQSADDRETLARTAADEELQSSIAELTELVSNYHAAYQTRLAALEAADVNCNEKLDTLAARIVALETAVFNIQDIVAVASNTVLVSDHGTLKDSGMKIGDDTIEEPANVASATTLATEKAVAKIVEQNSSQWSSF